MIKGCFLSPCLDNITVKVKVLASQSCLPLCNPLDCSPAGSCVHGDSPGKNTGVGCHPFSRGSSWPKDQTQVSCIAGGFFTTVNQGRESLSNLHQKTSQYVILDVWFPFCNLNMYIIWTFKKRTTVSNSFSFSFNNVTVSSTDKLYPTD